MPVSALELRPRGPVALFDAALHLCTRAAGPWALTLPGTVAVTAGLFHLVDAGVRGAPLTLPSLLLTLAWLLRALGQGAASHHVQALLLGATPARVGDSLRAALRRAPALTITTTTLLLFNALVVPLSLGLSLFFTGTQGVAYAVAMQGRAHPLAFYREAGRMLGPSRGAAGALRWLFSAQLLVFFNLHLCTGFALLLARKLVALDVTYLERFASLDNARWVAALAALTFGLFEPLRATVATLLLVDARVRREGLDLGASLEQLPSRRAGATSPARAALLLLALLLPLSSRAEATSVPLPQQLRALAEVCELEPLAPEEEEALHRLPAAEQQKLQRFTREVARLVHDEEDCEAAAERLEEGLPLALQAASLAGAATGAPERARAILAREEFQQPPERPEGEPQEEEPADPNSLWERFKRWWSELLERLNRREEQPEVRRDPWALPVGGDAVANTLIVVLAAAVLLFLVRLLLQSRSPRATGPQEGAGAGDAVEPLEAAGEGALARAPEGWAGLADRLAAEGRYREAVRSLYLALLARLHQQGAITYEPTLSNWDYFRGFRGPRAQLTAFRELTARFDFAWYGNLPVGAEGYAAFRELSRPLLAPPVAEASGA